MATANTRPSFSFGGSGQIVSDFAHLENTPTSVALQLDGKIVASGWIYDRAALDSSFVVARYNRNGTLDTSFSDDGWAQANITSNQDAAHVIMVLADGKILAVGHADQRIGGGSKFALVRYNGDGTLDASFSGDGIVISPLRGDDAAGQVAIDTVGRIVVAGFSRVSFSTDFALARYQPNGSLDTGFSSDGWTALNIGLPYNDHTCGVSVLPDGKLLVGGSTDGDNGGRDGTNFALARYNADGTLDPTFSEDGIVTTDFGPEGLWDRAGAMLVQPDGRILLAGQTTFFLSSSPFQRNSPTYAALARYNPDGTLDRTFSGDGKLITGIEISDVLAALQADGKIVVAGSSPVNSLIVARYGADGRLDTTFSQDGKVDLGSGMGLSDLILQPDGKIVVTGKAWTGATTGLDFVDFALARLNSDGSMDPSFGVANAGTLISTLDATPTFHIGGAPTVLDSNVQITDAELNLAGNYAGATLTLSRHGGANAADYFAALAGGGLAPLETGAPLQLNGLPVGTVLANEGGTLRLVFGATASEGLVSAAMQQIAYGNTSTNPPNSVQIDWTFSDGNHGSQGTGGALSIVGSTNISVVSLQRQTRDGGLEDDRLQGTSGDDRFDGGGGGIDTAVFTGTTVRPVRTSAGWEINGPEGHDLVLPNVERLQFADGNWALDLDGHAGIAVRILGAVFGPSMAQDEIYLGIGIAALDAGTSYSDLIQLALNFRLGANASHSSIVETLYSNVVGVAPSENDLVYFTGLLGRAEMTPAQLGVFAAETELNAEHVGLSGLQDVGVGFIA